MADDSSEIGYCKTIIMKVRPYPIPRLAHACLAASSGYNQISMAAQQDLQKTIMIVPIAPTVNRTSSTKFSMLSDGCKYNRMNNKE